jgi:hypothetical protein
MLALVDESILLAGNGCYLLACVVLPLARKAPVRRELRRLSPRRRRIHWKDEEQRERMALLRLSFLLSALLQDVGRTEAFDLLIESRQTVNDLGDRKVIAEAQLSGSTSGDLSYKHTGPMQEPLLALADVLAGAVMAQVRGDSQYLALLPSGRLTVRSF